MKRFLLILMPFMAAFFLFSSCAADSGNDEKDSKNTGGDETVYYTLVLDANGGEGSVTYSDIKANQEFLLETASALGVKREGYTFLGWARNAASSTANYSDGGKVVVNTNIKLYAVWKKDATPENPNPDTPTPQEPENPKENSLDCLLIESEPQKTEYYTGDSVDLTGIVVKAKYTDGTAKSLETSDFNYSPKTLSSAGTQTVTVTYKEKTVTFDIKVYALLTGLAWSSKPTKTKYNLGDAVDTTGAKLLATYSDGTNKTIETGFTVTPETLETEGTQVITIGFGGKTVTYSVEVIKDATPENPNPDTPTPQEPENPKENSLDCLLIESEPQKTEYYTGDSVDLTGIVVKAKYTDGTAKSLETSDFNYSPKTLSSAGTQTVTVTYKEKTVTFDIKVYALLTGLAWSSKPTKTKYNLGDAVDTTGAKLLATYSDGTNKTIETGFTVTPETLETEGTQVITIGFGDKTVTYSVEVIKAMNFSLDVTINDFTDIEGLLSYDEGAKTFIAKDDFKYYAWWIDNKKITNSNGFCKITQSLVSDKLNHTIMVIVTDDDGNRYSATAEFSIR